MNYDQCKYSEHDLSMNDLTNQELSRCYYVECPECGSIRKPQSKRIYGKYHSLYPVHNTLIGTSRSRPQWWKQNRDSKRWAIVQESEVK